MRRHFKLQPKNPKFDRPLEFWIDFDSGELGGPSEPRVRQCCEYAIAAGYVTTHPWPTAFDTGDPYREARSLALVLGVDWILPPLLKAAHPKAPPEDYDDDPPGLVY